MTRGLATPTNGAPSKKEAVRRLMSQGVTSPQAVAEQTGIAIKQVYSLMSTVRSQRGEAAAHRATLERRASFWPQDKLQKAQRLVGKTLIYIARTLDVPPAEMIGALGPLLRDSGHFEAVLERMAGGLDAEPLSPDEDERARDEAELARLEEEDDDAEGGPDDGGGADGNGAGRRGDGGAARDASELAAPAAARAVPAAEEEAAPAAPGETQSTRSPHQTAAERFKLGNEAGEYLHEHTRGMTRISRFVWRGSKAELDELLRRKPHLNTLVPEPC